MGLYKQNNRINIRFNHNLLSFLIFLIISSINALPIDKLSFFSQWFCITIFGCLFFYNLIKKKFVFNNIHLILLSSLVMLIISLAYSLNQEDSIRFVLYYIIFVMITIFLSQYDKWYTSFYRIQFIFSSIHVFTTLFSFLFTQMYINIVLPYFSSKNQAIINSLVINNAYPGLAGQTGTNAFFISIGIGILICSIFDKNSKTSNISMTVLFVSFFIALILTQKRSLLLSNVIAIYFVWKYSYQKEKNKMMSLLGIMIILGVFIYILITFVPGISYMFSKFNINIDGDISSGRFDLYKLAFEAFKQKPWFGNGINTVKFFISDPNIAFTSHNDVLQLLAELGMIGTFVFILPYVMIFRKTIRLVKYYSKIKCVSLQNQIKKRAVLLSFYFQIIFCVYGLFGNPIYNLSMLWTYLIFCSIPLGIYIDNRITD